MAASSSSSFAYEDLWRDLAPQVLGAVVRRYGDFDGAEDAVQEALIAAARQWPEQGVPDHPKSWLIQVATRRLIEIWRSDDARRRREDRVAMLEPHPYPSPPAHDDTLRLLVLCCHPSLTAPSAIALTLRAVGGLTTAEIAAAFLVPEATMAQRISRAKQTIKKSPVPLRMPTPAEWPDRLAAVLRVLYLIFNEAYLPSGGGQQPRTDLAHEAIRLTRAVRRLLPGQAEVAGLLALMLLTDARRAARTGRFGELIPLDLQDRRHWDQAAIAEGTALIDATLGRAPTGPYQLQAAIAALHDEAATADDTDWPQILALYLMLEQVSPNPMVTLNRAVALAMVDGPAAGLALLPTVESLIPGHYRVAVVRGHLLERAGDLSGAVEALRAAAVGTNNLAEQHHLITKIAGLRAQLRADS